MPLCVESGIVRRVVRVELFGVARLRAGQAEVQVEAHTLREALSALGRACPALEPSIVHDGRLAPGWLVALNGAQITADSEASLETGDVVVLVSADAGG